MPVLRKKSYKLYHENCELHAKAACVRNNCENFKQGDHSCIFNGLNYLCQDHYDKNNCVYKAMDEICDDLKEVSRIVCRSKYDLPIQPNKGSFSIKSTNQNYESCRKAGSDVKIAQCVKQKCENSKKGDASCVFNGIFEICFGVDNRKSCIDSKMKYPNISLMEAVKFIITRCVTENYKSTDTAAIKRIKRDMGVNDTTIENIITKTTTSMSVITKGVNANDNVPKRVSAKDSADCIYDEMLKIQKQLHDFTFDVLCLNIHDDWESVNVAVGYFLTCFDFDK